MAVVVLLIIAVLWVVVLVPPLLRSRSEHRSGSSIGDFNYRLGVLGRTNGAAPVERKPARAARVLAPPPSPRFGPQRTTSSFAAKRRRDVLMVLACATGVSLLVAVVGGGALWALQVLVDLLLVSYLALLGWYRRVQAERHAKVRYLAAPLPVPYPAPERMPLRRTASR